MTNGRHNRLPFAIGLGFVVLLMQVGALAFVGITAWNELFSPSSTCLRIPFVPFTQMLRGELAIPVCAFNASTRNLTINNLVCFRMVDLKTGLVRDVEIPGGVLFQRPASDGDRLWCFAIKEVVMFDGTTIRRYPTTRPLANQASTPFLYEGQPAVIDRDAMGKEHLLVFADEEWEDKGQVVLPGPNRKSVVDEKTGQSVLVPRTTADSLSTGPMWTSIHVTQAGGKYHLFQSDSGYQFIWYRVGFDFLTPRSEDEPASGLAPENALADATGWVKVDSKFMGIFGSSTTSREDILVTNDKDIWRQVPSDGAAPSTEFEHLARVDLPNFMLVGVTSSATSPDFFVLASPMMGDIQIYKLQHGKLEKMAVRVEGFGRGLLSWVGRTLGRVLAVLCGGMLILILSAAMVARRLVYSFGRDTVVLASLTRRCLARGIDMSLILLPLTVHAIWLIQHIPPDSILMSIEDDNFSAVFPLIFTAGWLVGMWIVIVVLTGVWGVSPGKWVFGIRVIRTTLRPCGMLRALLREVVLWFDVPFFLTAIPGVVCQLATENRQRIGDLVADTLVIESSVAGVESSSPR